jgi:hypothetical protein
MASQRFFSKKHEKIETAAQIPIKTPLIALKPAQTIT